MKGAIGYLILFGGIGAALYFLTKGKSPEDTVRDTANRILQDPSKAAQVPGATTQDKYGYLIQAGSGLLSDILKGIGVIKPTVATPGVVPGSKEDIAARTY
jgi:hypothetical protein